MWRSLLISCQDRDQSKIRQWSRMKLSKNYPSKSSSKYFHTLTTCRFGLRVKCARNGGRYWRATRRKFFGSDTSRKDFRCSSKSRSCTTGWTCTAAWCRLASAEHAWCRWQTKRRFEVSKWIIFALDVFATTFDRSHKKVRRESTLCRSIRKKLTGKHRLSDRRIHLMKVGNSSCTSDSLTITRCRRRTSDFSRKLFTQTSVDTVTLASTSSNTTGRSPSQFQSFFCRCNHFSQILVSRPAWNRKSVDFMSTKTRNSTH